MSGCICTQNNEQKEKFHQKIAIFQFPGDKVQK